MPTSGASTSCTSSGVQEDVSSMHLLLPFADGHGCAAPPPTPMAPSSSSSLPTHDSLSPPPAPLDSKSAVDHDTPSSDKLASPPSKEDLDALALFLMQQSLHSTPHLLASPPLRRKRSSSGGKTAAAIRLENDIMGSIIVEKGNLDAVSKRQETNLGEVEQVTYSHSGGFSEESKRRIGKACQEVGAFYIHVRDADSALMMLQGIHSADDASVVEGGLVPISEVITSTPQQHQYNALDVNPLAFDAAADTNFRDTVRMFANSLLTISKDLLRVLLEDLSINTQAHTKGHFLKPLLFIHDNATQHLSPTDNMISLISHDIDSHEDNENRLFLVAIGTQLQAWSQGEYKTPISETSCGHKIGAISIHFALVHDQ